MNENELSYKIIGIALKIHKSIGPGLLESAYENALVYDLREEGFEVKQHNQCHSFIKILKWM